jgi:parvulin-like peptidyl-prolyl isomerase
MKTINGKKQYYRGFNLILISSLLLFLFMQTCFINKVHSEVEQDTAKGIDAAAKKPDISMNIVAELNGLKISTHDLVKRYNLYLFMSGVPADYRDRVPVNSYLDKYMAELLLLQDVKKMKVSAGKDEVQQEKKKYLDRNFLTETEFSKRLGNARITKEEADRYFENNVIIYKFGIAKFGSLEISDEEAKKYFDRNYDHFNGPERVAASHILICHSESTGCRSDLSKQQAKEFAGNLRKIATPENFSKLAKQYSSDKTGEDGGNLGYITRGSAMPAFEAAAFSLEKGGISDVVETEVGFHIIFVTSKQKARSTTFEGAKETVKKILREEYIVSKLYNYSGELLKKADVKRFTTSDKNLETAAVASTEKAGKEAPSRDKKFTTFKSTGLKLNLNNKGQPVILFFSRTGCSHCEWISETFDTLALEYMKKGLIEAHHYDVVTMDDILTTALESEIPKEYLKLKKDRAPDSVPYFNFGGMYERVGTGYEASDDFFAEEVEMRQVIDALLKQSSGK